MDKVKYYHELTEEELKELINKKITIRELSKLHPQPIWCHYQDALYGIMGCWSLVNSRISISKKFCKNCDCYEEDNKLVI